MPFLCAQVVVTWVTYMQSEHVSALTNVGEPSLLPHQLLVNNRSLHVMLEHLPNWQHSQCIPAVLCVMQDVEDDSAIRPRNGMVGDPCHARVSHSMDVSVDLSNASHHYDVNAAS